MGHILKAKPLSAVLFALIALLLLFTHFLFLNSLPPGMSNDEIEYILSSRTYALNGTDVSGVAFPQSLFVTQTLGLISPVVPILLSPFYALVPLTLFTARIPYVLLSFLTAGVLGYLTYLLFGNKKVALLSAALYLLNPWSFFLSRFAADGAFALFFYLSGITLLLRFNGWKLIIPGLLFILGFFAYHGAKLVLLPVIALVLVYKLLIAKRPAIKKSLPELSFLGGLVLFITLFAIVTLSQTSSSVSNRSAEIVFLNETLLSGNVNQFRNQSITTPLNGLLLNKVTESTKIIATNYLNVFSPDVLFLRGDPGTIHTFYYHGLFYLMDILLLIAGFIVLWHKKRRLLFFFIPLILIAPLATALSTTGQSVANRSFLLLPLLLMISSYGIYSLYQYLGKKPYKNIFAVLIAVSLLASYGNFLFVYFARLPVAAQENYGTSSRVLAKLLTSEGFDAERKIVVIHPEPRQNYMQTIFYAPDEKRDMFLKNDKKIASLAKSYQLEGIVYTSNCPTQLAKDVTYILKSDYKCKIFNNEKRSYAIINQKDAGAIYSIFNSDICRGIPLTGWINTHMFSDYEIEVMDRNTFCQRWISKQ